MNAKLMLQIYKFYMFSFLMSYILILESISLAPKKKLFPFPTISR